MKAVVITAYGGAEVLQIADRPTPILQAGQVLIEVYAAGLNRLDILQRKGNYPAPEGIVQDIPGLEVAGRIVAVSQDVIAFKLNDLVMALVAGGGYAEYVVAQAGSCIRKPDNLSFEEAASLPEVLFTVWHNVFQIGKLKAGDRFLVHGGSGGVGSTAVQLAALWGATVYSTVGSAKKVAFVKSLGAAHVLIYKDADFEAVWKDEQLNIILDSIGGDYFVKNVNIMATEGRLIYINASKGIHVELNLLKLMQKRILLTGSTLRSRDEEFKTALTTAVNQHVMPLVVQGRFKPLVSQVFAPHEAAEAHRVLERGDFLGKLVLNFKAK